MLSKADDFPIHQTPEPIAHAGSDRNFYDRYFFNGYSPDGDVFFAVAMGIYPNLNIIDASFCVVIDGVQHNLRASRHLNMERMDTRVGPIAVEVEAPLERLRVRVDSPAHGILANILFHARALPVEEPRFIRRAGPRIVMDYTRLTQNGSYEGEIRISGRTKKLSREAHLGTRDRSWGIRPVGAADSQPPAPAAAPQFFWLWAPCNFADRFSLYHLNADAFGSAWNTAGVVGALGKTEAVHMQACRSSLVLKKGTRHAQSASIDLVTPGGGAINITMTPKWNFYMSGLGYLHPEWGHGHNKGPEAVGYDTHDLSKVDETQFPFLHVQAFSSVVLTDERGERHAGAGVLEQLILGPYAPLNLSGILDGAP